MLIMKNVSKTFNPGTVNEKCALKNLNLELKEQLSEAMEQVNLHYLMQSPEHFLSTGDLLC